MAGRRADGQTGCIRNESSVIMTSDVDRQRTLLAGQALHMLGYQNSLGLVYLTLPHRRQAIVAEMFPAENYFIC
jgi:hypothetical protein